MYEQKKGVDGKPPGYEYHMGFKIGEDAMNTKNYRGINKCLIGTTCSVNLMTSKRFLQLRASV